MENQKSALGMDGNVTALIGYLIGIVALVLIFIEKENKFVRYHAIQSVLWTALCLIGIFIIAIVGSILALILAQISPGLAAIVGILFFILYFAILIAIVGGHIYGAIKAYGGAMFKLPVVGNFAEKWSN